MPEAMRWSLRDETVTSPTEMRQTRRWIAAQDAQAGEEVVGCGATVPVVAGVVEDDVEAERLGVASGCCGQVVGIEEDAGAGGELVGLGRLGEAGVLEEALDGGGEAFEEVVAGEDGATVVEGGGVGHGGAGGDGVEEAAGDVGDEERDADGGVGRGGEAAAFDGGEVLADAVDLGDGGAAVDQGAVEGEGVVEREAGVEGKLHHGGGSSADEEEAEGVGRGGWRDGGEQVEDGAGSREGGFVGKRMASGEELEAFGERGGRGRRDEDALEVDGGERGEQGKDGREHGAGDLADGDEAEVTDGGEGDGVVAEKEGGGAVRFGDETDGAGEGLVDAALGQCGGEEGASEILQRRAAGEDLAGDDHVPTWGCMTLLWPGAVGPRTVAVYGYTPRLP